MHELPPMQHVSRQTVLDVHHAILPRTARLKPDSGKLLAASQPVPGEPRLRVLAPVDMVLHAATHLFLNEEFSSALRDLADLDSLLRHFGGETRFWQDLPARALELDLARPLYYALRYATAILNSPVPPAACRASDAGRPPRPLIPLMDALFLRALKPDRSTAAGLARRALYVRAHWLRMPPLLLARHLAIKAFRGGEEGVAR